MPNLHNRLKDSRLKLGLSQHEVAALCGVSQPTVANWERGGHIPRSGALDKLSETLNVDRNWLLSGHRPAEAQAAHIHLSKPIHHVPVYAWADLTSAFDHAIPLEYLTLSLPAGDYFAVQAPQSDIFDAGTTLIFDRRGEAQGVHLVSRDGQPELSNAPDEQVLGRLIYSLKAH